MFSSGIPSSSSIEMFSLTFLLLSGIPIGLWPLFANMLLDLFSWDLLYCILWPGLNSTARSLEYISSSDLTIIGPPPYILWKSYHTSLLTPLYSLLSSRPDLTSSMLSSYTENSSWLFIGPGGSTPIFEFSLILNWSWMSESELFEGNTLLEMKHFHWLSHSLDIMYHPLSFLSSLSLCSIRLFSILRLWLMASTSSSVTCIGW